MDGEAAIGAAAADPRIRAVIAEGATGRTAADKAGWLPGGVSGTVQRGIDRLTYGVTELLSSAPQPITLYEAIERTGTTPFLLITAGTVADETSPAAPSRRRRAARITPAPVTTLVAPTRAINGRSSLPVNGSCVDVGDTDAVAATVVPTAAAPAALRPRLNCSPSTCPEPPADAPTD